AVAGAVEQRVFDRVKDAAAMRIGPEHALHVEREVGRKLLPFAARRIVVKDVDRTRADTGGVEGVDVAGAVDGDRAAGNPAAAVDRLPVRAAVVAAPDVAERRAGGIDDD